MCVFVVCMWVFSRSDRSDLSCVCFRSVCVHVSGYCSINKLRYEVVNNMIMCVCVCVVGVYSLLGLSAQSGFSVGVFACK